MTKPEFAAHLQGMGYDAETCPDGVVVTVQDAGSISRVFNLLFRKEARKCQYEASGGVRARREAGPDDR